MLLYHLNLVYRRNGILSLNEIANATKHLNKTKEIKCIGLIGGSKFFSPGADIKELEKLNSKQAK